MLVFVGRWQCVLIKSIFTHGEGGMSAAAAAGAVAIVARARHEPVLLLLFQLLGCRESGG